MQGPGYGWNTNCHILEPACLFYAGSAQAVHNSVQQVHHNDFDRHVITKPCTIIVAVSR
jgi:hypothetical protein